MNKYGNWASSGWDQLYRPDQTYFDYKPSQYNYTPDKNQHYENTSDPSKNPYAYSNQYNDKYGNKIKRIRLVDFNDKVDDITK